MTAGIDNKLPFGNLPRLLLAWVCTEAVRTRKPRVGSRSFAFQVHADSGGLQQRRGGGNPAPQPDGPAL